MDTLYHAAVSASLAPVKEEWGLTPESKARLGDIMIPCWSGNRDTKLDVSGINSLQVATFARDTTKPGSALQAFWDRKVGKARDYCVIFVPLPQWSLHRGGSGRLARGHHRPHQ